MFTILKVTKYVSPRRSKGLIAPRDREVGKFMLLNANRMSDIMTNGSGTKFYYTENLADPRDGKAYVEVEDHWNEVTNALDTAYPSEFTIFTVYKNDDVHGSYKGYTIPSSTLVYADSLANDYERSYVVYQGPGGGLKRVLVNSSLEELSAINLLRDYDGNIYRTLQIGAQEWIIDNLRTTHYADGTAIPKIIDDDEWIADTGGAYCWYDNNDGYKEIYGALYNWYAVGNAHGLIYFTDGGVFQAGWRVPTRADYDTLVAAVGTDDTAGGYLKERGYSHWYSPNTSATDVYGWRCRGNGNRYVDETNPNDNHYFASLKVYDDKWTSEQLVMPGMDDGYSIYMYYHSDNFDDYNWSKHGGMAVRAVRDMP